MDVLCPSESIYYRDEIRRLVQESLGVGSRLGELGMVPLEQAEHGSSRAS